MQGGVAFEFQNVWYTKASLIAAFNIESFHFGSSAAVHQHLKLYA